jgi:hypothetical protein
MKYRVFATQEEAIAAEQVISQSMGYAKPGINAATGEIDSAVLTVRWATIQQIQDGRWVFVSPDEQGEEDSENWWPHEED